MVAQNQEGCLNWPTESPHSYILHFLILSPFLLCLYLLTPSLLCLLFYLPIFFSPFLSGFTL